MKMILGCLLVLAGTALAAGQTLHIRRTAPVDAFTARPVPPSALEARQNNSPMPIDVVATIGASQEMPDLPQPAVGISENPQPKASGDPPQSVVVEPAAPLDAHQARANLRNHESHVLRSCAYLGCGGHTLLGVGF